MIHHYGDIENDFREATGYGFDALTESEARYLSNYKPSQTVRDRILEERDAAISRRNGQDTGYLTNDTEGEAPPREGLRCSGLMKKQSSD